jgi:hypothetical protein
MCYGQSCQDGLCAHVRSIQSRVARDYMKKIPELQLLPPWRPSPSRSWIPHVVSLMTAISRTCCSTTLDSLAGASFLKLYLTQITCIGFYWSVQYRHECNWLLTQRGHGSIRLESIVYWALVCPGATRNTWCIGRKGYFISATLHRRKQDKSKVVNVVHWWSRMHRFPGTIC